MSNIKPYRIVIGVDYGTTQTCVAMSLCESNEAGDCISFDELRQKMAPVDWYDGTSQNPKALEMVFNRVEDQTGGWTVLLAKDIHKLPDDEKTRLVKFGASDPQQIADEGSTNDLEECIRATDFDSISREAVDILNLSTRNFLRTELGKLQDPDAWLTKTMEAMWTHRIGPTISELIDKNGLSMEDVGFNVVIGVPANWSVEQVQRYASCLSSGMGVHLERIQTIDEAHATLIGKLTGADNGSEVKLGSCYTMFDAGGGTVDAASFRLTSMDPLELRQVGKSLATDSDWHGFETVFHRAQDFLKHALEDMMPRRGFPIEERNKLIHYLWGGLKADLYFYSTEEDQDPDFGISLMHSILQPPEEEDRLQWEELGLQMGSGWLRLTQPLVRIMIDASVQPAVALLQNHMQSIKTQCDAEGVKYGAVFVSGGFSQNKYFKDQIRSKLAENETLGRIPIVFDQGRYDKAALARGAACFAGHSGFSLEGSQTVAGSQMPTQETVAKLARDMARSTLGETAPEQDLSADGDDEMEIN